MFSLFSQPIFYLVKNGLHQCVPEIFPVKNDMLFSWKTKKIMVKMNCMCSIWTINARPAPSLHKKEWLSIFNRPQLRVQVSSVPQNAMIVLLKTLITRSQWLILLLWLNLYKLNNIIYGMSSHFFQFHFFSLVMIFWTF